MRRFFRELFYDLKEPGINTWFIPLIFLCYIIAALFWHKELGQDDTITLAVLELLVPFWGGYASLMLMQGLLDTAGCEIMFTYPRSNFYWGIYRQLRFFACFSLIIAFVCFCIAKIMNIPFIELFFLTMFQSFAVVGVAFGSIAFSRKVSVGLVLLLSFVLVQVTVGREFGFLNFLYILTGDIPELHQIAKISFRGAAIGFVTLFIGQLWIHPTN